MRQIRSVIRAAAVERDKHPAYLTALLSASLVTLLGLVYGAGMVCFAASGKIAFPPGDDVQLFGGVTTALAALLLPVLFVSAHELTPARTRVFSMLGVVFCTLFSAFVAINRFVQLSVVRLSLLAGDTEGLERFLPYDGRSALFALETTGWGVMLGLAAIFLALALPKGGLLRAVKTALSVYAALGLTSGISFMLDSPLSVVGFAAWGFVLYVATGLLLVSLLGYDRHWAGSPGR
jgi:hypothetical protein